MRTLLRLLATSTVSFLLTSAAASADAAASTSGSTDVLAVAPLDAPQTLLVQVGTVAQAGGGQVIRYNVFQRVQPLVTTRAGASGSVVVGSDAICEQLSSEGWEQICTLAVAVNPAPRAAAPVAVAAASASPTPSESAAPLVLAIAPPHANPVSGRSLVVDVALPGAGPARLEMLDVMGRLITERDLGSLGAGRHAVDLSADRRVTPGIYLLRLTRAGDAKVARVTVID